MGGFRDPVREGLLDIQASAEAVIVEFKICGLVLDRVNHTKSTYRKESVMSDVEAVDWTMRAEWLELRRGLLFETEPDHFASACEDLRERLGAERESASAARRLQICHLLTELTIDIASYLPRWHLLGRDRKGDAVLSAGVARDRTLIEEQVQANIDLIERWSAPRAAAAREEIGRIDSSNLRRMSEMTDAGTIANRFGNDSPHGVSRAIRRGGILVTTNPVMVNNARKVEASHWREVRDQLNQRYSSAPVAQRAMHFAIEVVLDVARELRPIYLASDGCFGHVTYQVNPHDFKTVS